MSCNIIQWKRTSDIQFNCTISGVTTGETITWIDKSFTFKFFTTNQAQAKECSFVKETNTFTNCKLCEYDNNILELAIANPNFNQGDLRIYLKFESPNSLFSDGNYTVWDEIISGITIIN